MTFTALMQNYAGQNMGKVKLRQQLHIIWKNLTLNSLNYFSVAAVPDDLDRRADNNDCRKLKNASLGWPPIVQSLYEIL